MTMWILGPIGLDDMESDRASCRVGKVCMLSSLVSRRAAKCTDLLHLCDEIRVLPVGDELAPGGNRLIQQRHVLRRDAHRRAVLST